MRKSSDHKGLQKNKFTGIFTVVRIDYCMEDY